MMGCDMIYYARLDSLTHSLTRTHVNELRVESVYR